ncbi:hypothetical protein KIH78_03805, partial [Bifidobacterium sp. 79T10]|nr:hypothetical protein [Bifidobacterium saguinibicoloris]
TTTHTKTNPEPEEPRPEPLGGSERTTYTQTPTNATPPHHNTPQTPETQQTTGVSKTPKTTPETSQQTTSQVHQRRIDMHRRHTA